MDSEPEDSPAVLVGPGPAPGGRRRRRPPSPAGQSETRAGGAVARPAGADALAAVTVLYEAHALGLTRLAHVMLGDRPGAEDVVQEAFDGLIRHWDRLSDPAKAPQYLRSSVLNGCRTELRRGRRRPSGLEQDVGVRAARAELAGPSAETAVLADQERMAVLAAITRLPDRQREVLVLRYYLDEPDAVIASSLGIGASTVRSTLSRALAALGAHLRESS